MLGRYAELAKRVFTRNRLTVCLQHIAAGAHIILMVTAILAGGFLPGDFRLIPMAAQDIHRSRDPKAFGHILPVLLALDDKAAGYRR